MILRLKDFSFIKEQETKENDEISLEGPSRGQSLNIKWIEPDLAEEIDHYDDKAKLEFYQHNITIGNRDIEKSSPRATKFYRYIIEPFKKGSMETLPVVSDDEFNVNRIQNLMSYEFDNIVAGAYGKSYGEVLSKMAEDLKKEGSLTLPAPIVVRFINFGETRTSSESSYYLFSGNRRINLALQYNLPIKVWVINLVPSRRDVREFAQKSGVTKDPIKFKKLIKRATGKESLDELTARERFKIIQSLKTF